MYVPYDLRISNSAFIYFAWFSLQIAIISLNSVNQLISVMVKCGVLFEVRTELLNIIYKSFGLKGLISF
jgi:hypothetical protein